MAAMRPVQTAMIKVAIERKSSEICTFSILYKSTWRGLPRVVGSIPTGTNTNLNLRHQTTRVNTFWVHLSNFSTQNRIPFWNGFYNF